MATQHDCIQEDSIRSMKERFSSMGTRVFVLMGAISLFVFLVGFSASQSAKARDRADIAAKNVDLLSSRIDVQEERLRWILEGIKRIEEKLEKMEKKP